MRRKPFAEQLDNCIQLVNLAAARREDAFCFARWRRHHGEIRHLGERDKSQPHFEFRFVIIEKKAVDASALVKSLENLAYAKALSFMGDRPAATLVDPLIHTR